MGFDNDLFLKGKDAELVILDPKERWKFSEKNIYSKLSVLIYGTLDSILSFKRIFVETRSHDQHVDTLQLARESSALATSGYGLCAVCV